MTDDTQLTLSKTAEARLSWPRDRRTDGTAIVGWTCDNCGHEVEAPYKPSRLARCPNCGGNQQGVRGWTVEQFVEERRERLLAQLAQHHGLDEYSDADVYECVACGATETVHIVHPDGSRGRRHLDAGSLDDYMDAVDDDLGWHRRDYGISLTTLLVRSLDQ